MDALAARIVEAITNNEKVALFGDYDVDGASACALMSRYLRHFGLDPECSTSRTASSRAMGLISRRSTS